MNLSQKKEGTQMKKVISLLLALVMCLSLCACGAGKDPAKEKKELIVGEWLFDNGYTIIFNADHSGKMLAAEEYEIKWSYDEELDYYPCKMISDEASKTFEITYNIGEDGSMSIFAWGNVGKKQAK